MYCAQPRGEKGGVLIVIVCYLLLLLLLRQTMLYCALPKGAEGGRGVRFPHYFALFSDLGLSFSQHIAVPTLHILQYSAQFSDVDYSQNCAARFERCIIMLIHKSHNHHLTKFCSSLLPY